MTGSVSEKWLKQEQKRRYRALHAEEIAEKKAVARVKRIEELQQVAPWKIAAQNFRRAVWRMLSNPFTQYRTAPLPGPDPSLHGCLDEEMFLEVEEFMSQ
jgi:hypothetical protein